MKKYKASQAPRFFDVELRVQWLLAKELFVLFDEQKERNRQKSKVRAQIEHVFGYMSQTMKGFYLRYIGRWRNGTAIGFIKLIYNLARYEQIAWLKLSPLRAV